MPPMSNAFFHEPGNWSARRPGWRSAATTSTEFAGRKVFVIRAADGIRAFRNVCRHRGARLLPEGAGRCATIRCPYHQWVWGEDGGLKHVPWWGEDAGFDPGEWSLDTVAWEVWRGLLFLAIDPVETLERQLGALPPEIADEPLERYAWAHEERLVFDANWKIYTDNFVEGYHFYTYPLFKFIPSSIPIPILKTLFTLISIFTTIILQISYIQFHLFFSTHSTIH